MISKVISGVHLTSKESLSLVRSIKYHFIESYTDQFKETFRQKTIFLENISQSVDLSFDSSDNLVRQNCRGLTKRTLLK